MFGHGGRGRNRGVARASGNRGSPLIPHRDPTTLLHQATLTGPALVRSIRCIVVTSQAACSPAGLGWALLPAHRPLRHSPRPRSVRVAPAPASGLAVVLAVARQVASVDAADGELCDRDGDGALDRGVLGHVLRVEVARHVRAVAVLDPTRVGEVGQYADTLLGVKGLCGSVPRVCSSVEEHLDHALARGGRLELDGQVQRGRAVEPVREVNVGACKQPGPTHQSARSQSNKPRDDRGWGLTIVVKEELERSRRGG